MSLVLFGGFILQSTWDFVDMLWRTLRGNSRLTGTIDEPCAAIGASLQEYTLTHFQNIRTTITVYGFGLYTHFSRRRLSTLAS